MAEAEPTQAPQFGSGWYLSLAAIAVAIIGGMMTFVLQLDNRLSRQIADQVADSTEFRTRLNAAESELDAIKAGTSGDRFTGSQARAQETLTSLRFETQLLEREIMREQLLRRIDDCCRQHTPMAR